MLIWAAAAGLGGVGCHGYRVLDFRGVQVEGFPDSLCGQRRVKALYFGPDGWTLYPPLSALPSDTLNQITALPACIGQLGQLEVLSLQATGLRTIDPALFGLERLRHLDLSGNPELDISRYAAQIVRMKRLQHLNIAGCQSDPESLRMLQLARPELDVITSWHLPP
ncbi:MAG: hypothetical protein NW241_06605 [Bacteroidia bacterium]|nr:hypothetical protein [Bacteroidia bacterium]